jgi:hypothetical protein
MKVLEGLYFLVVMELLVLKGQLVWMELWELLMLFVLLKEEAIFKLYFVIVTVGIYKLKI